MWNFVKVEEAVYSKTLLTTCKITRCHNLEHYNLNFSHCDNPISRAMYYIYFKFYYSCSSREHLIISVFLVSSTLMSSTFVDMKILLHINVSEFQLSGLSACQTIQVCWVPTQKLMVLLCVCHWHIIYNQTLVPVSKF